MDASGCSECRRSSAFLIGTFAAGALVAWPKSPRDGADPRPTTSCCCRAIPYYLLAILLIFFLRWSSRLLPPAGGFSPTTIIGPNINSILDIGPARVPAGPCRSSWGHRLLGPRGCAGLMVQRPRRGLHRVRRIEGPQAEPDLRPLRDAQRAPAPDRRARPGPGHGRCRARCWSRRSSAIPGLGGLLFGSILGKDIFVINGIVLMLIVTLAVAASYNSSHLDHAHVLDPRIDTEHDRSTAAAATSSMPRGRCRRRIEVPARPADHPPAHRRAC